MFLLITFLKKKMSSLSELFKCKNYGGREVQNKSRFLKQNNKLQMQKKKKAKQSENTITSQKTQRLIWKQNNKSEITMTNQTNRKR